MPINAGVSNDSRVRTKRINSTDPAVGISKRSVMRLNVCQVRAPDIIADSSKEGSIDLNAATMRRNARGTCPTEWTQIIPGKENTLNGGDFRPNRFVSQTLRYPNFGLSKNIHAMDSRTPGRIKGTTAIGTKMLRSGVLVRSVSHASIVPNTKESAAEPEAKISEFIKVE